jgi:ribosomal-protein-alanine N-acetyltransferase
MGLLEFIPATRRTLALLASEPDEFAAQFKVGLHEAAQSVADHSLAYLKSFPYETRPRNLGYLVVEGGSQQLAGTCSFKGPPADGVVEIAYYTFAGFEGRGIATAMARFLLDQAAAMAGVTKVIAHTLPENNASTRILEKLGMTLAGLGEEDGVTVWRWELELPPPAADDNRP